MLVLDRPLHGTGTGEVFEQVIEKAGGKFLNRT